MPWIDTHVHLFTKNDSDNTGIPEVFGKNSLNTPELYIETLGANMPDGVVIVDFSKAKDSEHVVNSLDELAQRGIKAAGVIKGNLADARTLQWIKRPDVKAIRLYAKDSMPDVSGQEWKEVFVQVTKDNKHILIFGEGANLTGLIKRIPENVTILVDHLGVPKIDGEDKDFKELLVIAKARGNIYFKGPGYRTSLDVQKVKLIVREIIAAVGSSRVMLGASDAPFAGFGESMNYEKVLGFIGELANDAGDKDKLLYSNAKDLYGF
ncbi:MAG: metal-dependent hydrolase [Rickettsiaceae bacterium]|jgi:predicted TIM-barrel fold metal-dependent hydrolase|nr:metal-dependent hydrolase [Rickettsiaceae bacterium]